MVQWLVIGIGNEFRGDDAVGCLVARKLKEIAPAGVRVIEHQGDGTALLRFFQEADRIILIDAVVSAREAGFFHRLDLITDSIPVNFIHNSSHLFGVIEAVALGRELHQLPSCLLLYGIEGKNFRTGILPSPEVVQAGNDVIKSIITEVTGHPMTGTKPERLS